MVAGLMDGLDHEESANFAFLLATPVIFLAGILKLPDLMGPLGDGVRYQTLVGSLCAMVTALISVKFLTKWFTTKTLIPSVSTVWSPDCSASFDSPSQKVRDGRRWRDRG